MPAQLVVQLLRIGFASQAPEAGPIDWDTPSLRQPITAFRRLRQGVLRMQMAADAAKQAAQIADPLAGAIDVQQLHSDLERFYAKHNRSKLAGVPEARPAPARRAILPRLHLSVLSAARRRRWCAPSRGAARRLRSTAS